MYDRAWAARVVTTGCGPGESEEVGSGAERVVATGGDRGWEREREGVVKEKGGGKCGGGEDVSYQGQESLKEGTGSPDGCRRDCGRSEGSRRRWGEWLPVCGAERVQVKVEGKGSEELRVE